MWYHKVPLRENGLIRNHILNYSRYEDTYYHSSIACKEGTKISIIEMHSSTLI